MTGPIPIFSHRSGHITPDNQNQELQIRSFQQERRKSKVNEGILAGLVLESLHTAPALSEPAHDFSKSSLSELIGYIVRTHHDFIREELPRLHELAERVWTQRKWQNPETIELCRKLRRLSGDLTFHMSHCENTVFPYIEALEHSRKNGAPPAPSSTAQTESLIEEVMVGHAPAAEMLRQIEADTHGFTPREDACPDMIGLYNGLKELARRRNNHVQLEGLVLFPRALALEKEVLAAEKQALNL